MGEFVLWTFLLCCILYICVTCTVHRMVISIEHLATANAGFFVLLASLPLRERSNSKLSS